MSKRLLVQAPAVPRATIEKLAFFTIGDNRQVSSPHLTMTTEEMWRRRAEDLAPGHAHGVGTIRDAIDVIEALPAEIVLDEVFFLGHGSGDDFGFFFFSGHPDPGHNFAASDDNQLLEMSRAEMTSSATFSETKELLIKLFKRLARADPRVGGVKINLLACFMGQGETHWAVCDFLDGWLVGAREVRFEVGAYENFYETVFVTAPGGNIVGWEDHIVEQPGGTELVPNPGMNQIPAFEVSCAGVMVGTP
ncbi:MAG: hypothetical protein GEU90_18850 [Gemmatimonas sp.]|nr:hypothetical protein [Gemmatimonas sp.]